MLSGKLSSGDEANVLGEGVGQRLAPALIRHSGLSGKVRELLEQ